MTINIKQDIIITTPIGTKLNLKDMIINDPFYDNMYEPLYEEGHIKDYLSWLEGEDRENYIRLEEEHNPVQFKKFREDFPEYFENMENSVTDNLLVKLQENGKKV